MPLLNLDEMEAHYCGEIEDYSSIWKLLANLKRDLCMLIAENRVMRNTLEQIVDMGGISQMHRIKYIALAALGRQESEHD